MGVELREACNRCDRKFISASLLKQHINKRHIAMEKKPPAPTKRGKAYGDGAKWKESYPLDQETFYRMKGKELDLTCPHCKFTFNSSLKSSFSLLVRHFDEIYLKGKCKKDKYAVKPPPDMIIEINDSDCKKAKYTRYTCAFTNCPEYGKMWHSKYDVWNHWQNEHIDSVDNPVLCNHCPKKLVSSFMLELHMKQKHFRLEGKKFTCSVCGAIKDSMSMLRNHERRHQSSKTFKCEYCDFKTNIKTNLTGHQKRMHESELGIQPTYVACDRCGKKFKGKGNLRSHMDYCNQSSTPDPKYQCPVCNKQLKQDNSFRKHMANVHGVGERCDTCNKLYKTKEVLERHIKIAHGE